MSAVLFIGRYQPLHQGHIKLIRSALDEGKEVVVAIRETLIDRKNPYTVKERKEMFRQQFGDKVKLISIPDISEVRYGRKVGYAIREVQLDKETESISATKIREEKLMYKIIWLMGESGAGKTTTAKLLQKKIGGVVLDGNEMRDSISVGAGFSKKDRHEHNLRVARLAVILSKQIPVIISVIAPLKKTRRQMDEICGPNWVYLKRKLPKRKGHIFEEPKDYFTVDTDNNTSPEVVNKIIAHFQLDQAFKK